MYILDLDNGSMNPIAQCYPNPDSGSRQEKSGSWNWKNTVLELGPNSEKKFKTKTDSHGQVPFSDPTKMDILHWNLFILDPENGSVSISFICTKQMVQCWHSPNSGSGTEKCLPKGMSRDPKKSAFFVIHRFHELIFNWKPHKIKPLNRFYQEESQVHICTWL